MADYLVTDTELTSIADAIRMKGGTSASLVFPTGFESAIDAIPTGDGDAQTILSFTVSGVGDRICYIDDNGTFQNSTEDSTTLVMNGLAVEGSLVCVMESRSSFDFSVSGLTEEASISVGGRNPNYSYVHLYTVGT